MQSTGGPVNPTVVLVSAGDAERLARYAEAHLDHVLDLDDDDPDELLPGLAWTTQTARTAMAHRLAVVCASLDDLRAGLAAFLAGRSDPRVHTGHADGDAPGAVPTTAAEAAELWVRGHDVPWREHWRRRPVRQPLPAYPFHLPEPVHDEVLERLTAHYREVSGIPADRLDPHTPFEEYGLTSLQITELNAALERDLGVSDRALFFRHRTLAGVAGELAGAGVRGLHRPTPMPTTPVPMTPVSPNLVPQAPAPSTLIPQASTPPTPPPPAVAGGGAMAIVGIAGRYPHAPDLDAFWTNLVEGRDCVGALPPQRHRPGWPVDRMVGGFLDGVDEFDPLVFGITPRDAALMDPQERLFLQACWEALDDAGLTRERMRGSRVGVFAGAMYSDYQFFGVEETARGNPSYSGGGIGHIANRVSFFFDLDGPSLTVDTMCASTSTALHLAVRALRQGECEVAVVGAVNLSLHPNKFLEQSGMSLTSGTGRCRAFGEGGDGFVPSEGVGALVLRPLAEALAGRDRVRAVVRGTAVAHAGRTNGYLVPDPVAQSEVIRRALDDAGLTPDDIDCVEAHGTGTALGDPIEVDGLTRVFGGRAAGGIPIGSVKSVIGHAEAAAGMASLTKVLLQFEHRTLAPTLHVDRLNPDVDWAASPFAVQRHAAPWPDPGRPRRAGISSFGAGGAITHVVVEEAPPRTTGPGTGRPQLVVLSAYNEERLREVAGRLVDGLPADAAVDDIAWTLQVGRAHLKERLAFVAADREGLRARLRAFLAGDAGVGVRGRAEAARSAVRLPTSDLDVLARHWVAGGSVDWPALHPEPRWVVSLPSYPFARMRCHFEGTTAGAAPTGVELMARRWLEAGPVPSGDAPVDGTVLCLHRPGTASLAARIARDAPNVVPVAEHDLAAHDPTGQDPARHADLLARHPRITGWLDLTDLDRTEDDPDSTGRRLALLRAVVAKGRTTGLRVLAVTRGLQDLDGVPAVTAGARMAGFLRVLGAEHAKVVATVLDTDVPPERVGEFLSALWGEWHEPAATAEVCHRAGLRHRPVLRSVAARHEPLTVAPELTYVVTGGTRGLGARVAAHLVERGARRIALLGRHPLPPEHDWDDPLDPVTAERVRTVRDLRRAGARVEVHAGALTDRVELRSFLDRVRRELGPIGGVVHCAGGLADRPAAFTSGTPESVSERAAPKVDAVEHLLDLTSDDELAFFLTFSSASALVPGLAVGVSEYAAANAAMDLVVARHARSGKPWLRSVAWPMWRDSGSGRGGPNVGDRVGLGSLTDARALHAMEQVLATPWSGVVLPVEPLSGDLDVTSLLDANSAPVPPAAVPPVPAESDRVVARLVSLFAPALGIAESDFDADADFQDIGVDSVVLVELLGLLEREAGRSLPPSVLMEFPSVTGLARHLTEAGISLADPTSVAPTPVAPTPVAPAPVASAPVASVLVPPRPVVAGGTTARGRGGGDNRIAIIGMAGRFPGAPDVATFWRNLVTGRSAIGEVPRDRWDVERLYDPEPRLGRSVGRWGGFVDGLADFDPEPFGLTDEEAAAMDPGVRLILESTWDCLHDGGYTRDEVWGRRVAVVVGGRTSSYGQRAGLKPNVLQSDQNFLAAQVAHRFHLTGPNLVVDSACSSALVSVQVAARMLLAGDAEMAVAGGVEVLLDEQTYLEFSAAGALSPTGVCRPMDERADGIVPGEGAGVVLLKPLAKALADGDRVHAVIEAVAVNNDGHTLGVTTPSVTAQADVIRSALRATGRDAGEVGLVEAHGTATAIGDPIELQALTRVYRESTDRTGSCAIGSVKSNVGHLLCAAGLAGLVKVALAVEHGRIPATLSCERPNPRFDFGRSPFRPVTTTTDWPVPPEARVAALSSFGLGGTNAHVIVSGLPDNARSGQTRAPLPAPVYRRRRLWLDRPDDVRAPAVTPGARTGLLELRFVDAAPGGPGSGR
ncbi:beta-ketoacyl synthase N-terminal-like domain-containing protein [Actinosynnema sp. NPDC050801]|uniref:beta-ketoacyl synthase N-terminal-like domain-containing protein n=1 Tax=unclassified Actinosynnema TaxID=2637065 RepID=UPI0033C4E328